MDTVYLFCDTVTADLWICKDESPPRAENVVTPLSAAYNRDGGWTMRGLTMTVIRIREHTSVIYPCRAAS